MDLYIKKTDRTHVNVTEKLVLCIFLMRNIQQWLAVCVMFNVCMCACVFVKYLIVVQRWLYFPTSLAVRLYWPCNVQRADANNYPNCQTSSPFGTEFYTGNPSLLGALLVCLPMCRFSVHDISSLVAIDQMIDHQKVQQQKSNEIKNVTT